IAFAVYGSTAWADVPAYLLGQFAGAIIGAILVWAAYFNHWGATEDPTLKLAAFSTAPARRNQDAHIVTEDIGAFIPLVGVLAMGSAVDQSVPDVGTGLNPFLIGALVWAIGLSLGGPTGYAINPARDLGPRIAHAILPIPGKRDPDWEYSWVPVVAPIVGGIIGVLVWNAVI